MIAAVLRRCSAAEASSSLLPALWARSYAAGRAGHAPGAPIVKPGIPGVQHIIAVASGKVRRRRRRAQVPPASCHNVSLRACNLSPRLFAYVACRTGRRGQEHNCRQPGGGAGAAAGPAGAVRRRGGQQAAGHRGMAGTRALRACWGVALARHVAVGQAGPQELHAAHAGGPAGCRRVWALHPTHDAPGRQAARGRGCAGWQATVAGRQDRRQPRKVAWLVSQGGGASDGCRAVRLDARVHSGVPAPTGAHPTPPPADERMIPLTNHGVRCMSMGGWRGRVPRAGEPLTAPGGSAVLQGSLQPPPGASLSAHIAAPPPSPPGFLMEEDVAAVWRGPMVRAACIACSPPASRSPAAAAARSGWEWGATRLPRPSTRVTPPQVVCALGAFIRPRPLLLALLPTA